MAGFTEYLTKEGEAMLAKQVAGTKISFTKIICGDGYLSTNHNPRNMTALVNAKSQIEVETVSLSGGSNVIISAVLRNDVIKESFYFREKGIYMSDGEKEVLGIYANCGDDAALIEPMTSTFLKKALKTFIRLSDSDNINIELKGSSYASAPVIPETKNMEEFLQSPEAETINQGDTIIIGGVVYTFTGGDSTNLKNYADSKKTELISAESILRANKESGKAVDALVVQKMYNNIAQINKESEFVESKTTFVDENTVRTEFVDGNVKVTSIAVSEDDSEEITTTYYNEDGDVFKKRTVAISGNTVTEKEEVIQTDEDIIISDVDITIEGETLVINGLNLSVEDEVLVLNQ